MKHVATQVLSAAFLIAVSSGTVACQKTTADQMTVEVNGTETDFGKSLEVRRSLLTDTIDIVGTSEDGHSIRIFLISDDTGTFTEADYDKEAGVLEPQYDIIYEDDKSNIYSFDSASDEGSFTIEIVEFENSAAGIVSGTFEAELPGSLLNGETAEEHISLVGGTFTVNLDEEL